MGAPFWSLEEKRYFVRECLPRSNYATGSYSSDGKGFEELASIMQRDLDARGHSKRKYKANMLFQMWYREYRKRSPSASRSSPAVATTSSTESSANEVAQSPDSKDSEILPETSVKANHRS